MSVTAYLLRRNHMRGACENGRIIAASFDPQGVPDVFGHGIVPQVVEFAREEDRPRIIQDVELHGVMFFV